MVMGGVVFPCFPCNTTHPTTPLDSKRRNAPPERFALDIGKGKGADIEDAPRWKIAKRDHSQDYGEGKILCRLLSIKGNMAVESL